MTLTNYDEFIEEIQKRASYIGRAMAFYPDGRDYGIVTLIRVRTYVAHPHILAFAESTGKALDGRVLACKQPERLCGRIYEYTYQSSDVGEELYISRTI